MSKIFIAIALLLSLALQAKPSSQKKERMLSSTPELIKCGDVFVTGRVSSEKGQLYLKVHENSENQMSIRLDNAYVKPLSFKINQNLKIRGRLKIQNGELFLSFKEYNIAETKVIFFISEANQIGDLLQLNSDSFQVLQSLSCNPA